MLPLAGLLCARRAAAQAQQRTFIVLALGYVALWAVLLALGLHGAQWMH